MTNEMLLDLTMWQQEAGTRRTVNIDLGDPSNQNFVKIWVYDYDLSDGAFINNSEELKTLDLAVKKEQHLLSELAKLKEITG